MLRKSILLYKLVTLLLTIVFISEFSLEAQELLPVQNFTPAIYQADHQNWMISQSEKGNMFVANNKGLLEYNGAEWTLYPTPNESVLRSVNVIDEKVYTGFYMNFGYWDRNTKGTLDYISLSDSLNIDIIEDEQFWNITKQSKWLLFQSLDRIIIIDSETKEVNLIESENTITKLFQQKGEIYFQVFNEGLYTIENGNKLLVSNADIAKSYRFIGLFEIKGEPTFISENKGFFQLKNRQLVKWNCPADSVISDLTVYSAIQMTDQSIVLGTISNGYLHIDSDGRPIYSMNQSNGLSNNTALSLFEDRDMNIWIGLDNGIDCINTETPLQTYIDQKGRLGTTYATQVFKDNLYLGTNQGLFVRPVASNSEFKLIDGTEGQVWSLDIIDDQLFVGHNLGTLKVDEDTAKFVSKVQGTWSIKKVPSKPNLLIQGNYDGLYILQKENGEWQLRSKLKGFNFSSKYFEFANDHSILVNHEYKGVFNLTVDKDFLSVTSFNKIPSVKKGSNSSLVKLNDELFYASKDGVFVYEDTHKFTKIEELSKIYENDEYISGQLIPSGLDKLWAFTKSNICIISKEKLGNNYRVQKIPIPQNFRNELVGSENVSTFTNGRYIFGTSNGYFLLDPLVKKEQNFEVYINKAELVSYKNGDRLLRLDTAGEFNSKENNFTFQYNVPEFEKYLICEYQYELIGPDQISSPWSTASKVNFKNLAHGDYSFTVKARINNELARNTAIYNFTIKKPWHLSTAAIIVYCILGILLFLGINTIYKRYYHNQRARILEKTTTELKLKELASQKEIIQLKNEGLNQDIKSRNRELAISTMNMISKNTALNAIKDDLKKLDNIQDLQTVIKRIDESINTTEEWEFFEEAFNHADKDFFKKVKELHPQLTANDLRLCVYLRLNLSSKEIAPLLNISPRSVEIKRYRLRKKIELDRDINLNDYFFNL